MEKKKGNFWMGLAMLSLGVVIGFLIAPMKKGINVKNICGNQMKSDDLDILDDSCGYEEIGQDYDDEELSF